MDVKHMFEVTSATAVRGRWRATVNDCGDGWKWYVESRSDFDQAMWQVVGEAGSKDDAFGAAYSVLCALVDAGAEPRKVGALP